MDMPPPPLVGDAARLGALDRYAVLDTPAEAGFDDIVHLACTLCAVPVALVSLVAGHRQWFKARIGFPPCETDLSSSVCAHVLGHPGQVLVIPDLADDPRTAANPLVTGEPFIRFYAGAPLVTADGHVLGALCAIDGAPRPEGLTPTQSDGLVRLARQVMAQLELRRAAVARSAADERRTALLALGDRLRDLRDVAQMAGAAAEIVGRTLGASRAGFGRIAGDFGGVDIESDWTAAGVASIAGRHRFDDHGEIRAHLQRGEALVIEDVGTDARTRNDPEPMRALGIVSLVNVPVRERGRTAAVFVVHDARPRVWAPEELAFVRNVADRLQVGVGRVQAEDRQTVLNQELAHRLKNTLSVVQSIAAQTLRNVTEREMVEGFERRVLALSRAHDVLLLKSWSAARLHSIAESVLALQAGLDRFVLDGPDMDISTDAALSLSLLLHELATNAVKYGALSNVEGRVALRWRADAGRGLVLDWAERGGPPIAVRPDRRGFGSRLIRMGLLGTRVADIRYEPEGLRAEFRAPLADVTA